MGAITLPSRPYMREDALPADEFKLLDERLARWTADRQRTGRLPPDYELRAKSAALAQEFRNNRDEARPIFTVEEQRDVDASRAACSLGDRIDGHQDLGASLRQVSVQYAISNALGELDARGGTPSDSQARMDALLNSVLGYRDGAHSSKCRPYTRQRSVKGLGRNRRAIHRTGG